MPYGKHRDKIMPHGVDIPHLHRTLIPLAAIYSAVVTVRNKLFDCKLLPVEEFPVPVISVGNLTVGGTGKTPHIEWLTAWLSQHYRVAILSRGYRRKSHGFLLADENSTAALIGDEPYQIHRKFPHVTVAVDANRRRGITRLLSVDPSLQVILLDDAYQHRYVRPTFAIVLNDYNRPIYADYPLPAGRLREPMQGIQRADAVVISKCPTQLTAAQYAEEAAQLHCNPTRLFASSIVYGNPQHFTSKQTKPLPDIAPNGHLFILTGIANPLPLQRHIEQYYPDATLLAYPDHHNFTQAEIDKLVCRINNAPQPTAIITTEKDAARLYGMNLPTAITDRLYVIPLVISMQDRPDGLTLQQLVTDAIEKKLKRQGE